MEPCHERKCFGNDQKYGLRLVDLQKRKPLNGIKWVYNMKGDNSNTGLKFKTHLVAKGFKQNIGRDNFEIYAPVSKYRDIRFVLALSVHMAWMGM